MNSQQKNDFIRNWYQDCATRALADYLGLSVDSVYARAKRMHLSRERQDWCEPTDNDIKLMQKLVAFLPVKEIAFKFNLTKPECEKYLVIPIKKESH